MVNHVVMWRFKDEADGAKKAENVQKAKALLDSLPEKIPVIRFFEVGCDMLHSESSYDLVLISKFENQRDLLAYQSHPEHVKVVEFLRKVHMSKVVVDYES
jgi:hypothetical protein